MSEDVLIDEIRAVRRRISERFGHDTRALLAHYKSLEAKYKDRILRSASSLATKDEDPRRDS